MRMDVSAVSLADTGAEPAGATGRRRGSGPAQIYQAMREDILCLRLRPGSSLDEVGLAKRFGFSRSPVREALIRLSGEGLVNILPKRSAVVAPFDLESVPKHQEALDLMQRVTCRLAASLRSDDDLANIHASRRAFEEACERCDVVAMIEANRSFHLAIAQAGRNPYFTSLYARLLDEGMRMLHLHFKFRAETQEPRPDLLTAEHTAMVRAVEDGDPGLAERLGHEHAAVFSDRFIRYMRQNFAADIDLATSTKRALQEVSRREGRKPSKAKLVKV